ncbi:unnamed protein product [Adineta steineri]|uniref:Uncharacterized protein n=1 Tax=Adineta steineri TaxID=433720 RepID=A0A815J402_9BILA|nr:unnamed protein product [Adineta steineri]CAF1374200.1 unnamed protein product [Adineta steineri]CAF1454171.1 unnamed protein product [Adineta steineri]
MNQPSNNGNKVNQIGRYSSVSNDEYNHSLNNGVGLSLQSFVDDIPFEFNPKYRTITVPNVDIPEYDTSKIRDILAKPIDFKLENKVLLEALEDVQRKKKEIQADTLRQQVSSPPTIVTTNCPTTNSVSIPSNIHTEHISFPVSLVPPPLPHIPNSHPTVHLPVTVTSFPVTPAPPPPPPNKPSISPSYRLPSVRDIYWPTGNQQNCIIPISVPPTITSSTLSLPTPIHSTNSSPNSVKQNNQSFNNCDSVSTNDLTATFDGTLGSNDPFHDAELKSLNDVAELRHLYTAIASANTVRR